MTGDELDQWHRVGVNAVQTNIREMQLNVEMHPFSFGNLSANASAIMAKIGELYGETSKQFFTLGLSLALLPMRYMQGVDATEHELATLQIASDCNIRELIERLIPKAKGDTSSYALAVSEVIKLVGDQGDSKTAIRDARTSSIITTYNLHGPNSRVNVSSSDYSVNTVNTSTTGLFADMRQVVLTKIEKEQDRLPILEAVSEMEQAVGKPGFLQKYQNFMQSAANHVTVLAPFLPELAKLLG